MRIYKPLTKNERHIFHILYEQIDTSNKGMTVGDIQRCVKNRTSVELSQNVIKTILSSKLDWCVKKKGQKYIMGKNNFNIALFFPDMDDMKLIYEVFEEDLKSIDVCIHIEGIIQNAEDFGFYLSQFMLNNQEFNHKHFELSIFSLWLNAHEYDLPEGALSRFYPDVVFTFMENSDYTYENEDTTTTTTEEETDSDDSSIDIAVVEYCVDGDDDEDESSDEEEEVEVEDENYLYESPFTLPKILVNLYNKNDKKDRGKNKLYEFGDDVD